MTHKDSTFARNRGASRAEAARTPTSTADMPLERYRVDDPFVNHPLFKSEEQARIEDTLSGEGARSRSGQGARLADRRGSRAATPRTASGAAPATSTGATSATPARPAIFRTWLLAGARGGYSESRGALAQLGERRLCKPEVTGSIPVRYDPSATVLWKRSRYASLSTAEYTYAPVTSKSTRTPVQSLPR